MALIRVITAVRYNPQGLVQTVRWGLANTTTNRWKVLPSESHVIHVLEALKYGEDVWTVLPEGDKVLPGPRVQAIKLRPGVRTIAMMPATDGTKEVTLAQLPVF